MDADIEQYVDATLKLHGMQLDATTHTEVLNQFILLKSMQQIVEQEVLPADIESAGVLRL